MPGLLRIRQAARVLARGGLVAYPTEAVFGFGCDPLDADALERLLALKGRRADMGLILLAGERRQLDAWMGPLDAAQEARLADSWPGPVTWIVPAAPWVPRLLTGGRATLAVRVTAHPLAAGLALAADTPIVSTSANLSGRAPARTALQVRRRFGAHVDAVLAGPVGGMARPTEIRDLASGRVLRAA
jgi:L-threonylcarbamoyladenylate synthase